MPEGCVPRKIAGQKISGRCELLTDEAQAEEPGAHGVFGVLVLLGLGAGGAHRLGPVSYTHLDVYKRQADGRVLHALLQHCDLVAVAAAAEGGLPALPDTLWVFDGPRMLQHTCLLYTS